MALLQSGARASSEMAGERAWFQDMAGADNKALEMFDSNLSLVNDAELVSDKFDNMPSKDAIGMAIDEKFGDKLSFIHTNQLESDLGKMAQMDGIEQMNSQEASEYLDKSTANFDMEKYEERSNAQENFHIRECMSDKDWAASVESDRAAEAQVQPTQEQDRDPELTLQ